MVEAAIVSTARTPIGKAYRGAFNDTHWAKLAGHVMLSRRECTNLNPQDTTFRPKLLNSENARAVHERWRPRGISAKISGFLFEQRQCFGNCGVGC